MDLSPDFLGFWKLVSQFRTTAFSVKMLNCVLRNRPTNCERQSDVNRDQDGQTGIEATAEQG